MYDIIVSKQESMVIQTELVKIKKTSLTRLNEPVQQHTRSNLIRRVTR